MSARRCSTIDKCVLQRRGVTKKIKGYMTTSRHKESHMHGYPVFLHPPSSIAIATASFENWSMWSKLNSSEMSIRLNVRREKKENRREQSVRTEEFYRAEMGLTRARCECYGSNDRFRPLERDGCELSLRSLIVWVTHRLKTQRHTQPSSMRHCG